MMFAGRMIAYSLLLLIASSYAVAADRKVSLTPIKEAPVADDFSLPDIDGNTHRLTQYRGKVVILNFWATWCPPCRFEMPSMEQAWGMIKNQNIVMLAVNIGEDADTIYTFTADYNVTFPLLMDIDSRIIEQWPVVALPTSYVIDPQGRVVYRAVGGRDWHDERMLKKIRGLLQQ